MTAMPPRNFNPLRFCILPTLTQDERLNWIATAAYFRAQQRGFEPGHEAQDWLDAELEVDKQLSNRF